MFDLGVLADHLQTHGCIAFLELAAICVDFVTLACDIQHVAGRSRELIAHPDKLTKPA